MASKIVDKIVAATEENSEDVHIVEITRENVREFLDGTVQGLGNEDEFDTALDLAQADATDSKPGLVVIVIKGEA